MMNNLDKVFERNRITKQGIDAMITNYLKLERELAAALAETTVKDSLIAQRPWVGLTDDEINKEAKEKFVDYNFMSGFLSGASFAEAKLKEKNT